MTLYVIERQTSPKPYIDPRTNLIKNPELVPILVEQSWQQVLAMCEEEKKKPIPSFLAGAIELLSAKDKKNPKMHAAACVLLYEEIWKEELKDLGTTQKNMLVYAIIRHSHCEKERETLNYLWPQALATEMQQTYGVNLDFSVEAFMEKEGMELDWFTRTQRKFSAKWSSFSPQQKKQIKMIAIAVAVVSLFSLASCVSKQTQTSCRFWLTRCALALHNITH